jgi:hypothetical protein
MVQRTEDYLPKLPAQTQQVRLDGFLRASRLGGELAHAGAGKVFRLEQSAIVRGQRGEGMVEVLVQAGVGIRDG